jgi:cytochrome c-type biogenesis protein CcmH/NrfG
MADANVLKITTGGDLAKYFGLTSAHMHAFSALGMQLFQQGRMEDAATVFQGIIALDEHCYIGHAGIGALALAQNPPDLKMALSSLQMAVHLNPDDPNVHANLGEALLRSARFEQAAAAFKRALVLDPDQVHAGTKRAHAIIRAIDLIAENMSHGRSFVEPHAVPTTKAGD